MSPAAVDAAGGRIAMRFSRPGGFSLEADFAIPESGVTVFFGPSGCGKTTLLRCIAGLERGRGLVRLGGDVWQDDDAGVFLPVHRRRLGYVFQEASLFTHLTVEQNLLYGLKRNPDAAGRARLDAAVDLLGIGHLLARRAWELSGGERQRCAIARSLAVRPRALLMDEPLAALDHARRLEIMPWLEKLRAELSIPVFYVTHSEEELMRMGDRLVLLKDGRQVMAGGVAEVWNAYNAGKSTDGAVTAVVQGVAAERDAAWGLVAVDAPGGLRLWLPDAALAPGSAVRLQVDAANVSLALARPERTSILNVVPVRVTALQEGAAGAQALATLDACGSALFAQVTRKSASELGLRPGLELWAQVKAVSLHR
ncbi:MAG: molybdenum ABC transporter ATP-binding protein [Duodenibacillus sp.]|nr:molybdenum ABC transporter ATP-binding protein [Duodenibacillus sp.]